MKRNGTTSRLLFALGAVLVVSSVLPATAQSGTQAPVAPPPPDLLFGEEVDVERVRGLREDFRILVDGEEVDVDYFTEVVQGRTSNGNGETPPAAAEGGDVVTNYVLFVDNDHTQVAFRRPVLYGFRDRLADRLRCWGGGTLGPTGRTRPLPVGEALTWRM